MSLARRLSRLAIIPTGPVLLVQARRLRRDTPLLPDAAQPWTGAVSGDNPLRLLVIGDSTAAGVGAPTQDEALPGNLARALAVHTNRGIQWRAIGENGATARDLIDTYLDEATAETHDVVFVTIGANDALAIRSRGAFSRDMRTLLERLRGASPDAAILVSSLPAFTRFELLPNPLRFNLYLHSMSLEDAARSVVARMPGIHMSPPPPPYTEGFFATDLFHPSASGYRDWARFAVQDAVEAGAL